jgi:Flp pilus assembly protein TadD
MALAACLWVMSLAAAQDLPTQTPPTAISAFENGKFEDAVTALSDILRRTPDDPDANYYLGMAYFREGRPKEARPFLERATQLSPSKPSPWKGLGLVLLGANDYPGASVPLARACALDPKDEDSCYLLGRSLFVLGRYDEAIKPFEKALGAAPPANQAAAHRAAALNFAELGMTQDADRHFRDAIRLYPAAAGGQPDPRVDYGAFLTRQGRALDALAMLHQSAAASPTSPRAHAELGRALLESDRPAEALGPLKRAVDLDPAAWAVRLMLGKAYLRLGRREEGERELRLGREAWAKQDYGSSKIK